MNNNKQSMKLYTEEQLKKFMQKHVILDELTLSLLPPIKLPSDEDVWRWWQTQKFQKEQGEQEYTMLYEIDLPKILKAFIEHLKIKGGNNE